MRSPRLGALGATFILVLCGLVPALATAASSTSSRVVIFMMYDQPIYKPSTIYLTADAGPYLAHLKWTGWGTAKAVGTGRFVSDCASCVKANAAVTVTLTKITGCPKHHDRVYTSGVFVTSKQGGGSGKRDSLDLGETRKIYC